MPLEENASNEVEATSQDRKSRSRSRSRSRRTSLTEVSSLKGESNSKSEEDGNKKDEEESRMTSAFGMVQSSKKDSIKSTENDVEVTNTNLNEKKKEKSPETEVAIREFNALPEGAEKFHKLSWPRLGLMLMVSWAWYRSVDLMETFQSLSNPTVDVMQDLFAPFFHWLQSSTTLFLKGGISCTRYLVYSWVSQVPWSSWAMSLKAGLSLNLSLPTPLP